MLLLTHAHPQLLPLNSFHKAHLIRPRLNPHPSPFIPVSTDVFYQFITNFNNLNFTHEIGKYNTCNRFFIPAGPRKGLIVAFSVPYPKNVQHDNLKLVAYLESHVKQKR